MKEYVVDTHALLWHFLGSKKLSLVAKNIILEITAGKALGYVSAIVIGEAVASLIKKDAGLVDEFLSFLNLYSDNLLLIDVTADHCKKLKDFLNKTVVVNDEEQRLEIHDSLIMILANELNLPVITKDSVITASGLVNVIW